MGEIGKRRILIFDARFLIRVILRDGDMESEAASSRTDLGRTKSGGVWEELPRGAKDRGELGAGGSA